MKDVSGWQPIETAPKDGSPVLLFVCFKREPPEWITARWQFGDWELIQSGGYAEDRDVCGEATHWAALPLGPNGEMWTLPVKSMPTYGPPTAFEASMHGLIASALRATLSGTVSQLMDIKWATGTAWPTTLRIRMPSDVQPQTPSSVLTEPSP